MTRPLRTISYIVYPSKYLSKNANYRTVDTFAKAKKLARGLGAGSQVHREIKKMTRMGDGIIYTSKVWELIDSHFYKTFEMIKGRAIEYTWS